MRCRSRASNAVIVAVAVVTGVVAGAVAPAVQAKGIARLAVCGRDGCVDRTALALRASEYPELLISGGTPVAEGAVTPEPFVRLRFGIGDGVHRKVLGRYSAELLPRSGYLRTEDGGWAKVQGDQLRAFRRVALGVPRLPAARLGLARPAAAVQAAVTATAAAPGGGDGRDGDDGGPPWVLMIAGGGVLAAAAAAALARRRRSGADPFGAAGGAVR